MEFHLRLYQCFQLVNERIVTEILKIGLLPGQPKVIEFLMEHNGARPIEIAAGCYIDKSTVASLISRLDKANIITKAPDPKDNRSYNVFLTDLGWAYGKQVKQICQVIDQESQSCLTSQEADQLASLLAKLAKNLENRT